MYKYTRTTTTEHTYDTDASSNEYRIVGANAESRKHRVPIVYSNLFLCSPSTQCKHHTHVALAVYKIGKGFNVSVIY